MPLYSNAVRDPRVHDYLPPVRIVASEGIDNPQFFVNRIVFQSFNTATDKDFQKLNPGAWLLLDFGREIVGGIRMTTAGGAKDGIVRVRFGESVSEAMSTPNQDHSIHDDTFPLPMMGCRDFGSTGFRFARIDGISGNINLMGIIAVATYHDLPRIGTFECNDERVNSIYNTAVYTVQLSMQDYIYDGVKRDRLVWLGDLNPEIRVILSTFDDHTLIRKSLDFLREATPLPQYMNSMMSYSLWWIINQYELYMHSGNLEYLREQKDYLVPLIRHFSAMVDDDGHLQLGDRRCFLDWPTSQDKEVQAAGGHGLFAIMFSCATKLCRFLGDEETARIAESCRKRLGNIIPDNKGNKTAAAMLTLAGICDASSVLTTDSTSGVSTFYGYYVLLAQPVASALDVMRKYWGAMLDYGATTFWEDFNLDWIKNSNRIDELPVAGKDDLHADFGDFCYKGLRHSLCHGWSGGPAAFLMEKVLGVTVTAPGARKLTIHPNLCDLEYIRGTFPTPMGPVYISKRRGEKTKVTAPSGIEINLID
ncbi:MAG: hypothetical protein J6X55_10970 [Victivallales bacterium]|nr:hypothetical protein [Victivallales bacterium]